MPTQNKAFIGAYRKGRKAWEEFGDHARCPYPDLLCGRHNHIPTFSRTFRRQWFRGYDDASAGLPDRYLTPSE